jgi:hypothetical protein
MRSVGYKTDFTGMVRLAALGLAALGLAAGLALSPARASTSGNNEPDPHLWDRWNWPALNTEELAQQDTTTPPATPPATTAPATPPATPPATTAPATPAPPAATTDGQAPPAAGADGETQTPDEVLPDLSPGSNEDFSVGEIPSVEVIELTPEVAKKALDGLALVHEKYKDSPLENYENLQDFVDQDPTGKAFEADLQTFGFKTANEWNVAVTTIGFAYSNLLDDQTADLKQQIEEVKSDTEMAQDMRDRMIQALSAMIPSDNNRKVVGDLMKDPAYADKLKLLETEEE